MSRGRIADAGAIAVVLFAAAVVQASMLGAIDLGGGRPDVLLVALVAVALARGSAAGALAGFGGGLTLDLATFETLGLTSLLLTLTGYWVGRYGETTGRDRVHAPLLSVLVATIAYGIGAYALHTILGDTVSARVALGTALAPAVALNLVLMLAVHPLVRRLLRPAPEQERPRQVQLLG